MKTTNKQVIEKQLRDFGYVDNHWAIDTKVTTRLGAVIFKLKEEGWLFDDERSGFFDGKNWRYYLKSAPKEKDKDFVQGAGHLPSYAELEAKGMFA